MKLTQAHLKEVLSYDAETGVFRWLVSRGRVKAGSVAGCSCSDGYVRIRIDDVLYLAQRLAILFVTGQVPSDLVDHENRNRSDNSWNNLRDSSKSQNACNAVAHADAKCALKGVTPTPSGTFAARICVNRKHIGLGTYPTPEMASAAYSRAARELHGEFARFDGAI